jgi:ferric-dicitrate binding protein FerR (iron transport regulator)
MSQTISDNEIQGLITGFLSGALSEQEQKQLSSWIEQDKAHLETLNRMRSAWIVCRHEAGRKAFDAQGNWPALNQRITTIGRSRFARSITSARYVASLALCIALTVAVMVLTRNQPASITSSATPLATTINIPLGSKSNIVLPDGSTVWINAGSTLTCPADFGVATRELRLTGEAFFVVKSDSLMPFDVHAEGLTVRALGTRFNVKAYPDDDMMAMTLEEGMIDVRVQASGQSVKLKPKEQLVVRKSPQHHIRPGEKTQTAGQSPVSTTSAPNIREIILHPNIKTELATSWKDAQWIIVDEPLSTFVTALERRYNLEIHFDSDELKNYKFTGTIENETVEQVLAALSMAVPANYHFNKNSVVLCLNKAANEKYNEMLIK